MRRRARQNAMRSGVVVVGALAFAYLSFRVGFKPYLDRAQQELSSQLQHPHDSQSSDASVARPDENRDAAAVVLKD